MGQKKSSEFHNSEKKLADANVHSQVKAEPEAPDLYLWTMSTDFEIFKSNVLHILKSETDTGFLKKALVEDIVTYYFSRRLFKEAFYFLALIDMVSKLNCVPLWNGYDGYRSLTLSETVWPKEAEMMDRMTGSDKYTRDAMGKALPEFLKYNIVEVDIRDVC